jgi:hypothetical protein
MHLFGSRIKLHKEEKIFRLFGRYDYHLQFGLPADELIPPSGVTLTFSRLMTYIYIYICRTALLTSRRCILYIYSTNIRTEYFKHAAHSPRFPLQNAVYFIMLPFLVHVLFTFYIQVC